MTTHWRIKGRELANCNCAYGCPCQFNALPTHGSCHAVVGFQFDDGHHGDVPLGGTKAAMVVHWPGPVHEGNGTMLIVIDERATPAQRRALERIMHGEDTEQAKTMWWVFSAMSPNKLPTEYRPIELAIDIERRVGRLVVPGRIDMAAEPIRNPVTGAEHRARIDLPHGFEYRIAEMGSGTASVTGPIPMTLSKTYAQLAELHLGPQGVIH